jgi:N utilization substance protein A
VRLAAKLLGWKIDIKSEEEKRQEVEQQMQALTGGPSTPIEQVTELGEGIIQKLIAAGITTVEALADMTPEQLEEIPGIGEKTLERISVAVRHYFGHFEEGEDSAPAEGVGVAGAPEEEGSDEPAALTAAADTGTISEGESEVETAEAVTGTSEAELENSEEVLREAEDADDGGETAEELAVEHVPDAEEENEEGGA